MVTRPKSIVPIIGEPDIDESYIRQQDDVVLKTLLIDRTMTALNGGAEVNIKWAVDDYAKEYPDRTGYGCEDQISIDAISSGDGKDLKVVTPRVKKRKEEQERRTAQKAEVFTPSWICNEQNNLVDEAWFGRKDNLFTEISGPLRSIGSILCNQHYIIVCIRESSRYSVPGTERLVFICHKLEVEVPT